VLHVTETYASGVASAIDRYCESTPSLAHHLLWGAQRASSAVATPTGRFESTSVLPSGHVSRLLALRATVRELLPDVIHAHSTYAGVYVRLAVISTRARPVVYTPHCFAFERKTSPPLLRAALWLMESVLALNTSCVAACSTGEAERARRLGPWTRVHVVPQLAATTPGTATLPRQRRGGRAVPTQVARLVAVGRLAPQKDPLFFLGVVRRLRESGVRVDATWVGDGDVDLRDALVSGGVTVTGWVDRDGVPAVMAAHDVYVHTAAWEGFPVTLMEAVSAGCVPVLRRTPSQGRLVAPLQYTSEATAVQLIRSILDRPDRGPFLHAWETYLCGHTEKAQRTALLHAYGHAS
jgi:glycosyltransferase involved in cell wall biosynthesis